MIVEELASNLTNLEPLSWTCLILAVTFFLLSPPKLPLPVINQKHPFDILGILAQKRFICNAHDLIKIGLSKTSAFYLNSGNGLDIVLDPKYADEIRNNPALSLGQSAAVDFHANIRGFEPFREGTANNEVFQDAMRMQLTKNQDLIVRPLSEETELALEDLWTEDAAWHDLSLRSSILRLVARQSSRVFLGDKVCRNPDWLRISMNYTVDAFIAAYTLRLWPKFLRPFVACLLPWCRKLPRELQEAREIITPVVEGRRAAKQEAIRQGKPPERYVDAMQWVEEAAKGRPYDPVFGQIAFSVATIHTTSDMLAQVLLDLCGRVELIEALRQEIITVIEAEGWTKLALYKLKLMDSVLKESQRLKPGRLIVMKRFVMEDVKLSDGTVLPKNSSIAVSCCRMWDPSIFPNAETFDAYRFLRMRESSGQEALAQAVSPSPEHLGFGLGRHVCPGRFHAINHLKITLCHMLLKYDFKVAEGHTPTVRQYGVAMLADPTAKISVRRRNQELPLSMTASQQRV
ncbi:putative cytochrome P450 [Aspergillus ellipticus CBS 707.79]|uniref:Putative cytochrome P450 n=1 Tax=Aspergillus ellipticus CBS 707.79 TaxID=1448320 RepID=A0A319CVB0_9EURO|nr:putative cytochrome P450 [Aspergillus ellipticus CBS 707.79]